MIGGKVVSGDGAGTGWYYNIGLYRYCLIEPLPDKRLMVVRDHIQLFMAVCNRAFSYLGVSRNIDS